MLFRSDQRAYPLGLLQSLRQLSKRRLKPPKSRGRLFHLFCGLKNNSHHRLLNPSIMACSPNPTARASHSSVAGVELRGQNPPTTPMMATRGGLRIILRPHSPYSYPKRLLNLPPKTNPLVRHSMFKAPSLSPTLKKATHPALQPRTHPSILPYSKIGSTKSRYPIFGLRKTHGTTHHHLKKSKTQLDPLQSSSNPKPDSRHGSLQ